MHIRPLDVSFVTGVLYVETVWHFFVQTANFHVTSGVYCVFYNSLQEEDIRGNYSLQLLLRIIVYPLCSIANQSLSENIANRDVLAQLELISNQYWHFP